MEMRIGTETCNWFGDICSHPGVVVRPRSVEELVAIVKDEAAYPSPVRAVGSNSSVTRCGTTDGGTLVDTTSMDRVLRVSENHVGEGTVTAEAGALYVDVAEELQRQGLQFNVNLDYGNLTMGTAACTHTKDGSFPGEHGQLSSYVVGVKLVTAEGEMLEVTEEEPELLRAVRTSFGLLGLVYEVTFRVEPLKPLAFYHESYSLDAFIDRLPELKARGEALAYYFFPHHGGVTVEFRRYRDEGEPGDRQAWALRNLAQRTVGPSSARLISRYVPERRLRDFLLDGNLRLYQALLNRLRSEESFPADQVIRFPDRAGPSSFTFSLWAFPEEAFTDVLRAYYAFCDRYYDERGYRSDMLTSSFHVGQDASSLLSYSHDGPVVTVDPVSSGGSGWTGFAEAFNEFGSRHGGVPLFNHTPRLTREQVEGAYGERLDAFRALRQRFDPEGRFLNGYFAELLVR
jgi:FAD/FMN-containing dehydrogenase